MRPYNTSCACLTLALRKQYGREVRDFDLAMWECERENIVLVGSYAKFAQNPAMRTHLLYIGDNFLAEAIPCDLEWGYRIEPVPFLHASRPCGVG